MRIKGKAVSNSWATGIPVESIDPLVYHAGVTNGNSILTSGNDSVGSILDGHNVNTTYNIGSSSDIGGSGSQSWVGCPVSDGFPAFTPATQSTVDDLQQVCVIAASGMVSSSFDHQPVPVMRSVFPEPSVPVQITTVDGCVATFVTSNNVPASTSIVDQNAPVEGGAQFRSSDTSHNTPVVLDFSRSAMLRNHEAASCVYNVGVSDPQTRAPARRRNRARGTRGPVNRQPTWTGRSSTRDSNSLPVYGPPAPPQLEGAPLDYMSFGSCDRVCQHCNALFWIEEKMAGLPVSAAPQYHKCCAGGRAVLRTYTQHPRSVLRQEVVDGLIHFLNENNALVRLFRTARDKLLEGDIPNFQIRLFGVAGASQYELPTADSIGVIVYEGGPESMTDYDVVIERHSREPESVNKLHPSYMSLQFPLLFIYGEEGYHLNLRLRNLDGSDAEEEKKMTMKIYYAYQKMELTSDVETASKMAGPVIPQRSLAYFSELDPTDNSKFIEARIYRKWTAMKGTAIQANADLKEKERQEHDLQLNCVYKIQGFGFEKTDSWGKTLDNDITLCFGKHTQIDLLNDDNYPYHYFNFAAYNELGSRLEKKNPILTDWEQEKTRNRVPLATLLQIDPNTQQDVTILRIDNTQDWYYQKCDECGGKLKHGFIHGHCHPYGSQPKPERSPHTEGLIKDVDTLLEEVADKNPQSIPPQILALVNTRHVLQFRFAKPVTKGPPTFVLQKVMDHPPSILPTQSEAPSSSATITMATQSTTGVSPPPATPPPSQDTPVGIPDTPHLPVSSNVRKELFPDYADEEESQQPKKQKIN
ncbi:hypothetical protein CTI12_AA311720 [Artemisia annua]|uniref:Helitron helicase-like domain-containing protein n=1 Tax=Artemisia annua TaxID=35608 RepID=A0A2U1MQC8_ARTAN|nr:hypothetical protein CTI12_AA311720 [Artemisia annua]